MRPSRFLNPIGIPYLIVSLGVSALAGCGTEDGGGGVNSGLTMKFINTGELDIVAFYTQPAGDMPANGWESLPWGANRLPVATLGALEFVLFADFERDDIDAMVELEGDPTPRLKWNVPAQWIADAEYLTVHAGKGTDGSWSTGHQFGLMEYTGEVDVTP